MHHLTGINWGGCETAQRCCSGLAFQPLGSLLDFCVNNSFNAIRLQLCAQTCLNLDDKSCLPVGISPQHNPSLQVPLHLHQ